MKLFSPAKLNLSLAVTGRRPDGFHSLVSLVVPLEFGDSLEIQDESGRVDFLECDQPGIPLDSENLILKASNLFRQRTGMDRYFRFTLQKRIPTGGGFGGGSSNGVCALAGINSICGDPLDFSALNELSAELGSDCPLFLFSSPVVIRGRGEDVSPIRDLSIGLATRRVHLLDPGFSSPTGALFQKMSEREVFTDPDVAEKALEGLLKSIRSGASMKGLDNDLGSLLAEKYLVYDTFFGELRRRGLREYGVTGSGSGAFVLSRSEKERAAIKEVSDKLLDRGRFMIETGFAGNDTLLTYSIPE